MSKSVDPTEDFNILIEQSAWAVANLPTKSLIEAVHWLAHQLAPSAKEGEESLTELTARMLKVLKLDSQEQERAERALIELLELDLSATNSVWEGCRDIRRDTNWARTYERAVVTPPTLYYRKAINRQPDHQLREALLHQAVLWRDLLSSLEQEAVYGERIRALDQAVASHSRNARMTQPITTMLLRRLSRHGPQARVVAERLSALYKAQWQQPSSDAVKRWLRECAKDWWKACGSNERRLHGLFEFSILLSITRAGHQSSHWKLDHISMDDGGFRARLIREDRGFVCEISKQPPGEDAYKSIRYQSGMTAHQDARDSQPDICICFARRDALQKNQLLTSLDRSQRITLLGDSKRNGSAEKKGANYLREGLRTGTYYQAAFAKELGLEINEEGLIDGPVRPFFTLFFRQGIETLSSTEEAIRDIQRGNIPQFMCYALEEDFPAQPEHSWSSTKLTEWFHCLQAQAIKPLER